MNGVLLFLAAWAGVLPFSQGTHASTGRLLSGEVLLSHEATASTPTSAALEFFVVNTSDDVDDGSCDLIHCSMREAIHAANASPGLDDIEIVRDVFPLSPLPHLVDPVNIFTGNGAALIGSAAGATDGLMLAGGASFLQGLEIRDFEGSGLRIVSDDNFILSCTIRDNGSDGVTIDGGANNSIGFTSMGNTLVGNGGSGVAIRGPGATGNLVRFNQMEQNAVGIDVAGPGPEPNDFADLDTGANRRQNYPVITAYDPLGLTPTTATLDSLAQATFQVDFYASPACHLSTYGEGTTYLATISATTDASGHAELAVLLPSANPVLTATATDPDGNTSEFSRCFCNGPDADSDGHPDCSDCDPADGTVHGPPLRVLNLRSDGISMIWDSDAPNSGNGTGYDVVSGVLSDLPIGAGSGEICLGTTSTTQLLTGQDPPPGTGFFFVVRSKNSCGVSSYGTDSFGSPRVTSVCPP